MAELGRFPAIEFHQYGDGKDDRLVMFAAPADVLVAWAGIPRKGWRLRALYQRWLTPGREQEVKQFWRDAAAYKRNGHRYLLGPTALTLAATTDIQLVDGQIVLIYDSPLLDIEGNTKRLAYVAAQALENIRSRLTETELESLES